MRVSLNVTSTWIAPSIGAPGQPRPIHIMDRVRATLWSDHHETRGGTKEKQMWESYENKTPVYAGLDAAN